MRPSRVVPVTFSERITSQPGGPKRGLLQAEVLIGRADPGVAVQRHR